MTGVENFFWGDGLKAAEILIPAFSLPAGVAAVEIFFDNSGFGLPGGKVSGQSWAEIDDKGSVC